MPFHKTAELVLSYNQLDLAEAQRRSRGDYSNESHKCELQHAIDCKWLSKSMLYFTPYVFVIVAAISVHLFNEGERLS